MTQAKEGDKVKVHYTGKLEDGAVFDTSQDRSPLEFTIGSGQVIPGFENAVVGLSPGEKTQAKVPPEDGYGPHHKEMVIEAERSDLPADLDLQAGQQLNVRQEDGRVFRLTVIDVTESKVTLDANHPLAGKDLTFDIELVEID